MTSTDERDPSITGATWSRIGKYDLLAPLGEGGMARVFLARQHGPMDFQKIVVVKKIHPHLARQPQFVTMFLDEARIAAQLNHPNVVHIYDLGEDGDDYFIVMEYLIGEPFSAVIAAGVGDAKPLSPRLAARIVADAAAGLHAAHELQSLDGKPLGVVHRDVSHGNLVVLYDGVVKVVDFGVAKAEGRLTQTIGREVKGKYAYMSPEQITDRPVDRRSDVFALGVVLWEALALSRLFRGGNEGAILNKVLNAERIAPSKVRRGVPKALDRIALKALALEPADRFQSAEEMRQALLDAGVANSSDVAHWMKKAFVERMAARTALLRKLATAQCPADLEASGELASVLRDESGSLSLPGASAVTTLHDTDSFDIDVVEDLPRWRRWRPLAYIGGGLLVPALFGLALWAGMEVSTPNESATPADETGAAIADAAGVEAAADETPTPTVTAEPAAEPAATPESDATVATEVEPPAPDKRRRKRGKRPRGDTAKAKTLYDEAIRFFVDGNLREAERKLKAAIGADSGYPPAFRGLGMVYERQGKTAPAIKQLRHYLRLAPWASDADTIRDRIQSLGG